MIEHSQQAADRLPLAFEARMEICNAHPCCVDALQEQAWRCDGACPNALSATIHWRAWRVINLHRDTELSRRFVAVVDDVLAFRASLPPEKHIWAQDSPSRVPQHWRHAYPEIASLADLNGH